MTDILPKLSTVPLLFLIIALAIGYAARRAAISGKLRSPAWIYGLLLTLALWGGAVTFLVFQGAFENRLFLEAYPLFWLPFIPVVLVVVPLMLFASARNAVRALIDATSMRWLIAIHALRLLAIGTIIKASRGEFSMSFAITVGVPDLLFGLSAVILTWLMIKRQIGRGVLIIWNILGVFVILPGAPVVSQMGLPGVFQSITETPSITTLFEFPMVLAPSLVVPLFVMMNLFVAIHLIEQSSAGNKSPEVRAR